MDINMTSRRQMNPHPNLIEKRKQKKDEKPVIPEKRKKTYAEAVKILEERYSKTKSKHPLQDSSMNKNPLEESQVHSEV
jgi:hypothetical protein